MSDRKSLADTILSDEVRAAVAVLREAFMRGEITYWKEDCEMDAYGFPKTWGMSLSVDREFMRL